MYMNLLGELAPLDRCHSGPEMQQAYDKLVSYYTGARMLLYNNDKVVNHWRLPPHWICETAELTDDDGKVIASKSRNNLEVFTYSPSVKTTIKLEELQAHLFSDPNRTDAVCFHFRNQYRHWSPEWGFSLPHKVRESLSSNTKYHVNIESKFDYGIDMVQSDYHHQGELDDTYLFIGHFDHPSMVNDGLAGCIAAYEIIKRLQGRKTKYSYRAFASVEIVGSVYFLDQDTELARNAKEGLFLGFAGVDSPLVYQQSYRQNSVIDRISKFLLSFVNSTDKKVFNHRQLIGNDENVFDSVGYEIPTGTLMRWPFNEYHTQFDNMDITKRSSIEETIDFTLRIIEVLEKNQYLKAKYSGLPSLASPDIDLYLSIDVISGVSNCDNKDMRRFNCNLPKHEIDYLKSNSNMLNQFMQNTIRLADGKHSILDIAELSCVPFGFALMYATLLQEKGLVELTEFPSGY